MTWNTAPLGELVRLDYGFPFAASRFNSEARGLPVVRIRDVQRGSSQTFYDGPADDRYLVRTGDYLIGMDGNFNLGRWRDPKAGLLNQRVCRIGEIEGSRIHLPFLVHYLPVALKSIEDVTSFATVKHLSAKVLGSMRVPLPPYAEQRRIAAILDQADALRAKRRQQLAHLEVLPQSIFQEMFTRPAAPLAALGDLAQVSSGITKGRRVTGETRAVPYLAVSNVQAGKLALGVLKTIEATEAEIQRYALCAGDLVLTEGGDPDKLGRGTVWRSEISECLHQNHIFRVRLPADGQLLPEFLESYLQSPAARRYFLQAAKQTTGIASINSSQLVKLPVPVMPLALQNVYLAKRKAVDAVRASLHQAMMQEEALFVALQSRAFRGEL